MVITGSASLGMVPPDVLPCCAQPAEAEALMALRPAQAVKRAVPECAPLPWLHRLRTRLQDAHRPSLLRSRRNRAGAFSAS